MGEFPRNYARVRDGMQHICPYDENLSMRRMDKSVQIHDDLDTWIHQHLLPNGQRPSSQSKPHHKNTSSTSAACSVSRHPPSLIPLGTPSHSRRARRFLRPLRLVQRAHMGARMFGTKAASRGSTNARANTKTLQPHINNSNNIAKA